MNNEIDNDDDNDIDINLNCKFDSSSGEFNCDNKGNSKKNPLT